MRISQIFQYLRRHEATHFPSQKTKLHPTKRSCNLISFYDLILLALYKVVFQIQKEQFSVNPSGVEGPPLLLHHHFCVFHKVYIQELKDPLDRVPMSGNFFFQIRQQQLTTQQVTSFHLNMQAFFGVFFLAGIKDIFSQYHGTLESGQL